MALAARPRRKTTEGSNEDDCENDHVGVDGAGRIARLQAAERMRKPLDQAEVGDHAGLVAILQRVGVAFLEQLCDPAVCRCSG
jgi:hypothetical protein